MTCNLSICTFRYVPAAARTLPGSEETEALLNRLNQALLGEIEKSGDAFLSNAVVDGKYLLRMCIVNFRTSLGGHRSAARADRGDLGARTWAAMQKEVLV